MCESAKKQVYFNKYTRKEGLITDLYSVLTEDEGDIIIK